MSYIITLAIYSPFSKSATVCMLWH